MNRRVRAAHCLRAARGRAAWTSALALLLALAAPSAADEPMPTGTLAVDFAASSPDQAWFVSALEESVGRELSRFHQVELQPKLDGHCPGHQPGCLIDLYRGHGVQVVILGRLHGQSLEYEIYDTFTRARAFAGSLATAGVNSPTLERHIGGMVRPIVARGGLLSRVPLVSAKPVPPSVEDPFDAARASWFLLAVTALLLWPYFLARLALGKKGFHERARPASWRWTALAALLFVVVLGAVVSATAREHIARFVDARLYHALEVLVPVAAGMLWGAFVLVNLGWVCAPIHGAGRVSHAALGPLLRSWLALTCLRGVLFAGYVTFLAQAARHLGLPEPFTLLLGLPALGLASWFLLLTLVDNLTSWLDAKLVAGPATDRNPWHVTMKRYFLGYVRRLGVELDPHLVERILFLPSSLPHVVSYGGGFARPRILVGESQLRLALGELPDETEVERTVNPEELPAGFVFPALDDQPRSAQLKRLERLRRRLTHAPLRPHGFVPRVFGEKPTLLGLVMALPAESGMPLPPKTNEEIAAVRTLLADQFAALEPPDEDEDADDTDSSQKDFLFGALIREVGRFSRGDGPLATIGQAITTSRSSASLVTRLFIDLGARVHARYLAAPAQAVADAYAALNEGLHHLVQYLHLLRGGAVPLTARADEPGLLHTSKEIFDRVEKDQPLPGDRQVFRATPRNRLVWLAAFFTAPLALRPRRWPRFVFVGAVALTVCALLTQAVRDAMSYHPIYVERMNRFQREAQAPPEEHE